MAKFGVVFLLFVIGAAILNATVEPQIEPSKPSPNIPKQKTPEQIRTEEIITKGFSIWDGSHNELEKYIKETMNDPDSYKHVETKYVDKGEFLLVKTTFRGKNAFGGVVKNSVTAKAGLDGNLIEIISQGQ